MNRLKNMENEISASENESWEEYVLIKLYTYQSVDRFPRQH